MCGTSTRKTRHARFRHLGQITLSESRNSVFALDFDEICEAWVIASRKHWQIELYDGLKRSVAMIAGEPISDAVQWRDYLTSLPRMKAAPVGFNGNSGSATIWDDRTSKSVLNSEGCSDCLRGRDRSAHILQLSR